MSKKVLVVGGGGREHSLVWKLSQSKQVGEIFACPGNPGIAEIGTCVDIKDTDLEKIADFAEKKGIDLTLVGPEIPLSLGIVDIFQERGLTIFGPNKVAARIEGSKLFAKEIMTEGDIPTARYAEFTEYNPAMEYVVERGTPLVIKADGLAYGKGTYVAIELEEAVAAIEENLIDRRFGSASDKLIIEDYLCGEEASVLAFVDGETILPLISSQDHKRIYDDDEGPNTGGMGAYCPAPIVPEIYLPRIVDKIFKPTIEALKRKGIEYKGVIYAGLMVGFDGPKVLEFNVRFGDPEVQALLPMMKNDLYEVIIATIEGRLNEHTLEWENGSSICVVISSEGYPGKYTTGVEINGLKDRFDDGVYIFHAGTAMKEDKLITAGGRVLNVVALGKDILEAKERVYEAIPRIQFNGMYFRRDIAYKALLRYYEQVI